MTTYYVSPSGNDSNNGTSTSTPLKTIGAALAKAQSSGDIIYALTGTYTEAVSIDQSGITLSAYTGNSPVIDGTTTPGSDWFMQVVIWGDNNKFSGFEIKNVLLNKGYEGGVGLQVPGQGNTITNVNIHHCWSNGILIGGDNNIVEDSTVWQNSQVNLNGAAAGWASGMSAARGGTSSAIPDITSNTIFRRNKIYNNWGEGISCYESYNSTMQDNVSYDNWTCNLYLSDSRNSLVQRNLVYISSAPAIRAVGVQNGDDYRPGLVLSDEVSTAPRSSGNTVINNFIYNADFVCDNWSPVNAGLDTVLIAHNTLVDGGFKLSSGQTIVNTNSQIRNNIIVGNRSSIASASGLTFSNNNWSVTPPTAAKSSTDKIADPLVVRMGATTPGALTGAYFKVSSGSPAINSALKLASVTSDFFQVARGATPTIGGYEFQGSADSSPPSTPTGLTASVASSSTINLSWNASTDNVGVTGYKIFRGGVQIGTATGTSYSSTGLTASTTYAFTVSAYDAAGNNSAVSASVSATTLSGGTPDTTAPTVPTNLQATATSRTQINLSWTASTDAVGVTGYKIYRGGVQIATTTGTSYSDSGLTSATTYSYRISAYDAAGNTSAQTAAVSATTQSGGTVDTTPPSAPTFPVAVVASPTQVNLSWTASTDNVSVAGYKIFRNGVQIGTSTGASYSDSGRAPNTTYTYTISAYDSAGNNSALSASVTITTFASPTTASATFKPQVTVSDGRGYVYTTVIGTSPGQATLTVTANT